MHSPKNYVILLLALTTVAGSVLAWRQYQELIALRAAALDPAERADWQKRVWAAEKRGADLKKQIDASSAKTEGPEETAAGPAEGNRPWRNRAEGRNNFMRMMEQPEVQRLVAVQQKAGLDSRYAALFKSLALTPEQLDKFKNLLVEKRTAMMDVMSAAREQGINPRTDPDAFQKLVASSQADIDNNIRSAVGDTAFTQYQDYEKTIPQRNIVGQLEQRLSYSSTPLTSAQSEQMVAILAATAPPPRGNNATPAPLTAAGTGLAATFGVGGSSRITDAAVNQSLGLLAAPQVEALRQLQQEQQAQAELNATMRSRFQGNRAGSTATTPAPSAPVKSGGG